MSTTTTVDKLGTTPNLYNLVSPAEASKVISFVLPVFGTLFLTGTFSWVTAIQAAIGILGTIAVFQASSNVWVKTGFAVGAAVLSALALVVTDATGLAGVSHADWWSVIGAAFGALGVAVVPNKVINATTAEGVPSITSLPPEEETVTL